MSMEKFMKKMEKRGRCVIGQENQLQRDRLNNRRKIILLLVICFGYGHQYKGNDSLGDKKLQTRWNSHLLTRLASRRCRQRPDTCGDRVSADTGWDLASIPDTSPAESGLDLGGCPAYLAGRQDRCSVVSGDGGGRRGGLLGCVGFCEMFGTRTLG